jgi:hypothetical protein
MPKATLIDLTGKRFSRLLVLGRSHIQSHNVKWVCQCDCGNIKHIVGANLRSGKTASCGCWLNEVRCTFNRKHGMSTSAEFKVWAGIKKRCLDTSAVGYHRYGGRGITMHPDWLNSFESFYSEMGPRPSPLHSVDRIDNGRGYEPGNCRWSTQSEQCNNKTNNVVLEFLGKRQTLAEWCRELGLHRCTVKNRLNYGWPAERALSTPPRPMKVRAASQTG